ncbi:MAG: hypothetical protein ACI82Z_000463, partial [Cellvibrionaceae bacterium]
LPNREDSDLTYGQVAKVAGFSLHAGVTTSLSVYVVT